MTTTPPSRMGRPPVDPLDRRERVDARIPKRALLALAEAAKRRGLSTTEAVEEAITLWLGHQATAMAHARTSEGQVDAGSAA